MSTSYIPDKDADFANWLTNFSALLTASPGTYGLTAGDAVAVAAARTAFQAAYSLAINPSTRTPATVAAKDSQRGLATATVRPYAVRISNNSGVSNLNKVSIGVTVKSTPPSPIPAPTQAPLLSLIKVAAGKVTMGYKNPSTLGKAKPYGVTGVNVWFTQDDTNFVVSFPDAEFDGVRTKTPFTLEFFPGDIGKKIVVWVAYVTRSGPGGLAQQGPVSLPVNAVVI